MVQKVKVCDFFERSLSPEYSIPVSCAVHLALNLSLVMIFVGFAESHDGNDLLERVSRPTVMYLDT